LNVPIYGGGQQLSPENQDFVNSRIREEAQAETFSSDFPADAAANISRLWQDPAIQEVWRHRAKLQVPESTAYFMANRLSDVWMVDYLPNDEDMLKLRVRTTGILQTNFVVDGEKFSLMDVGGQRSERRKWIQCFDSVSAVLFLCAIAEFDQVIFEDEKTNRVHEAINLFSSTIANNPAFNEAVIILFLNKIDLFDEKIKNVPLTECFPDFPGPQNNPEAAVEHVIQKFHEVWKTPEKDLYVHLTCATDTKNCEVVFDAVKDALLKKAMIKVGMFAN